MATILTNREFPGFVASVGGGGAVVAAAPVPNTPQKQWVFIRQNPALAGVDNIQCVADPGNFVGAAAPLLPPFGNQIVLGGAVDGFVPEVVDGGIRICLPGAAPVQPDLFWTLDAGAPDQPVVLMPLGAVPAATQIWDIAP